MMYGHFEVSCGNDWKVVARQASDNRDMRPVNEPQAWRKVINYAGTSCESEINSVDVSTGKWERIPVKVESGAIYTVTPPHTAEAFPLRETHQRAE